MLSVLDIVTHSAKHHAIACVIHALRRCMPWLNVVHVLAKPAAPRAQRMLRKQLVAKLPPLPAAMYATLTLLLAATLFLERNHWYWQSVHEGWH